jgi:serine protease AprX
MRTDLKISPAFEPFLAGSGPHDKREAIVLYRSAAGTRGRLDERAEAQRRIERKLVEAYLHESAGSLPRRQSLQTHAVGRGALPVTAVEVTRKTISALAEQPEVVAVLPNQRVHLLSPREVGPGREAAPRERLDWGLHAMRVPELWKTTRGRGVKVAVLDTGVWAEHPALAGQVERFVVIDPLGRRIEASPAFDGAQHGTHVSGIIAGKPHDGMAVGVAPEAKLLSAAVLLGDATLQTLLEGMSWAVEHGADILNLSLAFTYYEPMFTTVFDLLLQQYGVLSIVAIGNQSHGHSSSPGNAPDAFSVGAAERVYYGNKLDVAFFSSGASLLFPGAERELVVKPDLIAPGVHVYSCIPPEKTPSGIHTYGFMSGTSMAAACVSGAAALLMSARPEASAADVARALRHSAEHPDGPRRPDNRWGHGLVRPLEALAALS